PAAHRLLTRPHLESDGSTMRRRTMTTALTAALTTSVAAPALADDAGGPDASGDPRRPGGPPGPEDRPPQLLFDGTGLYPRVVRLAHNAEANDRLLASVVSFDGPSGFGSIWESTDDGATFSQISTVLDEATETGEGLCCATLFELPRAVGDLPEGTLLWSASVGQEEGEDRRMSIRIWASTDVGRSWERIAITAVAENEGGLWEPEFAVADDGELVLWFCDETDGENHSQRIVQQTSTDALTWTDPVPIIELEDPTARPGMPNVRRLRTGRWAMTYEICGPQDHCRSYVRTSDDPRQWGPATSRDRVIRAVAGRRRHRAAAQPHAPGGRGRVRAARGADALHRRRRALRAQRSGGATRPQPLPGGPDPVGRGDRAGAGPGPLGQLLPQLLADL